MDKKSLVDMMESNGKLDVFRKMQETMKLKRDKQFNRVAEEVETVEGENVVTIEQLVNELVAVNDGTLNSLVKKIHGGRKTEKEHRAFRHVLRIREEIKRLQNIIEEK
jgi:hypothetical protein